MKIIRVGETSIVLLVSYDTTDRCVQEIRRLYESLRKQSLPGLVSLRPGLDSLMMEFDSPVSADSFALAPDSISDQDAHDTLAFLSIPICYEFGTDLDAVCAHTGLSRHEFIALHTSQTYSVWMIGFMPGYPYIGKLPQRLQLPRKTKPAQGVPAGSVAIAEEFIGIYPFDSPGGWHVIGRTPLKLIDYSRENPSLFDFGMNVHFYRISEEEYEENRS